MTIDEISSGTEVVVRSEGNQGIEVQRLQSYGVGIDCHSQFIAICVHVRNNQQIFKYMSEADTDWDSLVKHRTVIHAVSTFDSKIRFDVPVRAFSFSYPHSYPTNQRV